MVNLVKSDDAGHLAATEYWTIDIFWNCNIILSIIEAMKSPRNVSSK